MGFLRKLLRNTVKFFAFFYIITLLPGLPPFTTYDFANVEIDEPLELKGTLEINNELDNTEHVFEGRVYGPEAIISRGDDIYTTINGGEVIKINGNHITHVAKFGEPCVDVSETPICGRPLGLAFDTIGNNLIVADAYYGIWQVDLSNGKKKLLISPHQELPGRVSRKARIFNSVAMLKNGNFFWTDSSSDFGIADGVFSYFAQPSGRVFLYDRANNVSTMVADDMFFANGIVISPLEDFVIFSETGVGKLHKYHITGPKKGQLEVFVDNIPGSPDNLSSDENGIWVALIVTHDKENPTIVHSLARTGIVRKFILRMCTLVKLPLEYSYKYLPNSFVRRFLHHFGHFETLLGLYPIRSTVIRVDWNGNIIGSLHGMDGSSGKVSHAIVIGDYLYMGSPFNRFLGRKKLSGKWLNLLQPAKKPTTTVPTKAPTKAPTTTTSTTPKPTTTTTKATTTTTTPRPKTTTTQKPTTKQPITTTKAPEKPKEPAPIHEKVDDIPRPSKPEKLKVIKKSGEHGEL